MPALKNAKHERFCREYVIDSNATQAAVRAGYSAKTAKQQGSRLLTKADVARRIAELQAGVAKKLEITQEKVLENLEEIRTAALGEGVYAAAVRAVELQGKHIGMWPNKAGDRIADSLDDLIRRTCEPKEDK